MRGLNCILGTSENDLRVTSKEGSLYTTRTLSQNYENGAVFPLHHNFKAATWSLGRVFLNFEVVGLDPMLSRLALMGSHFSDPSASRKIF
jgi:hypothetical protein